jgi:hypothetical protein
MSRICWDLISHSFSKQTLSTGKKQFFKMGINYSIHGMYSVMKNLERIDVVLLIG